MSKLSQFEETMNSNKFAVHEACQASFDEFVTDSNVSPDQYSPMERMMFQAGFVRGATWKQGELVKMKDELAKLVREAS